MALDFNQTEKPQYTPLAFKARPSSLEEFKGHEDLFSRYPFLKTSQIPSLILWGPPGTGKTTLAYILAKQAKKDLYPFSAVLGGVSDLKKLMSSALDIKRQIGKESIIFIDEIHRFNKAQQDALLPYVEDGSFVLIGATTENPKVSINRALLSRLSTIELHALSQNALFSILKQASEKYRISLSEEILDFLSFYSSGDARRALNILEFLSSQEVLSLKQAEDLIKENARFYDKSADRHYDVISAFIKSLRGSDPDAALLWLAIMLEGGEDPVFIARRLMVFASEDVGIADPFGLVLATSVLSAVQNIGMPEARINLAQATVYLASTYKSNAAYMGIESALSYVKENPTIDTPHHLKNYPPKGTAPYLYPHDYEGHFVTQRYLPDESLQFYYPSDFGKEKGIKERLKMLWPTRNFTKEKR